MESATTETTKRLRFDTTVRSPDDDASTPLSAAKNTIQVHCESLQPKVSQITSRLGKQHLLLLHKIHSKQQQAKNLEADALLIPRSARVKFALSVSKLAESDTEYIRLRDDTNVLVDNFQKELKRKIISCAQLESRLFTTKLQTDFASSLRVAVNALLICDSALQVSQLAKVVNTLLERYATTLLKYIELNVVDFRRVYQQHHTLAQLPLPFPTTSNGSQVVPSSSMDHSITKIARAIQNIFVEPWSKFLDVQKRVNMNLELQKLSSNHFDSVATDETNMLVDSEAPVDPPQLQSLIKAQVAKQTQSLQKELQRLRAQLPQSTKNVQRGRANGPSQSTRPRPRSRSNQRRKNKDGVAAPDKDSTVDNSGNRPSISTTNSTNESNSNNTRSRRNRRKSKRRSNANSS